VTAAAGVPGNVEYDPIDSGDSLMHRSSQLLFSLLLAMAPAVNAYAEEANDASVKEEAPLESSNMQSWEEDERQSNWTWFGMGYESRRSSSKANGASAPGSGGGAGHHMGNGHGGPGGKR
jgi:hypothetical protein